MGVQLNDQMQHFPIKGELTTSPESQPTQQMTTKAGEKKTSGKIGHRVIETGTMRTTCDRYGHVINKRQESIYIPILEPVSRKRLSSAEEAFKMTP